MEDEILGYDGTVTWVDEADDLSMPQRAHHMHFEVDTASFTDQMGNIRRSLTALDEERQAREEAEARLAELEAKLAAATLRQASSSIEATLEYLDSTPGQLRRARREAMRESMTSRPWEQERDAQ